MILGVVFGIIILGIVVVGLFIFIRYKRNESRTKHANVSINLFIIS